MLGGQACCGERMRPDPINRLALPVSIECNLSNACNLTTYSLIVDRMSVEYISVQGTRPLGVIICQR